MTLKAMEKIDGPKSLLEQLLDNKDVTVKKKCHYVIVSLLAISMSLFHLYTALFGMFPAWQQRSITLSFLLLIIFISIPIKKETAVNKPLDMLYKGLNVVIIAATVAAIYYILTNYPAITLRTGLPNQLDIYFGTVTIFLVLEATRRTIGWPMALLALLFLLYTLYGNYVPGVLGHPGVSYAKFIDTFFVTTFGLFSFVIGVMSTLIIVFIIFGAFLAKSGTGMFFMDLAYSVAGRLTGGPAQVAVVSSALLGSIVGSVSANVASTGAFTIPLMKRVGYKPSVAGAIETSASMGGQFMPPIMGAVAFLIVEYLQISYARVMAHALIPALLHFFAVGSMVYFEALKMGLKPLPKSELPSLKDVMKKRGMLIIPVFLIIWFLMMGYTPQRAGLFAILAVVVLSVIPRSGSKLTFKSFFGALELGARNALGVGIACACAGLIIAAVSRSGLGLKLSGVVIEAAMGMLPLALLFTAVACIILGMGMPTVSAYIILSVLVAPAIIRLDVLDISAHFFINYFGVLANITPPVAIGVFTAAAIAGAGQWETCLKALKLCAATYLIPFLFVYNPGILLIGSPTTILWDVFCGILTVLAVCIAMQGLLLVKAGTLERLAFGISALLLVNFGLPYADFVGLGIFLVVFIMHIARAKGIHKNAKSAEI